MWMAYTSWARYRYEAFGSTKEDSLAVLTLFMLRDGFSAEEVLLATDTEDECGTVEVKIGYGLRDGDHVFDRDKA